MLKPRYTITEKILDNIAQITAGREVIERAKIIPKGELKLQKEARIHNAHSSTSIEGNKLTLEEVKDLSEGREVVATQKDKKEVINYLKAMDSIPEYAGIKAISKQVFLEIHKTITEGTLKDNKNAGILRKQQVFVGRRVFDGTGFKQVVEYMPPDTKDVPRLVEEFLDWLNSDKAQTVNQVLLAGIVHYEVARIHPFIDGNGRTARLMAAFMLYKSGFDHRRFFAIDDYYDEDRQAYYNALKTVQKARGDITKWLEYFTDGVLFSINRVKETIVKLGISNSEKQGKQIELTPKQVKILQKVKEKGKITNKELQGMLGVSRQAVLKEISKLIDAGLIELVGRGRNAYYRFKDL
ncbi:MAG: Fic family protein [Candidatus Omnitrophota bacterium]